MTAVAWPSQAETAKLLVGAGFAVYRGGTLLRVVEEREEADELIEAHVRLERLMGRAGPPYTWRALAWEEYETLLRQQEENDG